MAIFLMTLFIVVCVLLIIVVLLQKGRGGGLGAAFGGAGTAAFGTRTGDVFTWVTIVLTALFLLLAIVTTLSVRPAQGTALAPVIMPASKETDTPVKVSFRSGTRGAVIYYTVDDSMPVKGAKGTTLYEDVQFEVKPGTTVRAIATRDDLKDSEVVQARYGPPTPTTASAPASMPAPAATAPAAPASAPAATAPAK